MPAPVYAHRVRSNVKKGVDVELSRLTLLVGPNGSGKTSVQNALELALMDALDTLPDMGEAIDLSGMNTTAMRMPFASGIGYSKRFTASGGENTINGASSYDVGYSSVSVGQYDLAYTQSVQNQVTGNLHSKLNWTNVRRFTSCESTVGGRSWAIFNPPCSSSV